MPDQTWQVEIGFTEEGDRTRADAVLELASQRFHGFGQAKRAPEDQTCPSSAKTSPPREHFRISHTSCSRPPPSASSPSRVTRSSCTTSTRGGHNVFWP